VTAGRHLIELGHLRDATPEQIVAVLRPGLEALIRGDR
jgi:hypothetical protein